MIELEKCNSAKQRDGSWTEKMLYNLAAACTSALPLYGSQAIQKRQS
jgi:hypothetical protein